MTRRHSNRRGMATVAVIGVVGVVATAVTLLTSTIAADARRTRRLAEDAQVRQLLLAETLHVSAAISHWTDKPADLHALALPAALAPQAEGSKEISIAKLDNSAPLLAVRAAFGRQHGSQSLKLTRTNDHWHISRITLTP
jgi:hypothetical protein